MRRPQRLARWPLRTGSGWAMRPAAGSVPFVGIEVMSAQQYAIPQT
jgi:hypothetical protein